MSTTTLSAPTRARGTTVALKYAMAVTGLFFVFFVLMHMYGNLKMFAGMEAYDGYAHYLRELGYPILPHEGGLWILRILLVVSVVVHVYAAATLWRRSRAARGTPYSKVNRLQQTYSARLMRWGGIILLAFVVFHLLHFTLLVIQLGGDYSVLGPYERMIVSFQNPLVYLAYLIPVSLLAMHVRHGVWSALATVGYNRERRTKMINLIAIAVAAFLVIGYMLPPTAILLGMIS